jgi:hypothetical protein
MAAARGAGCGVAASQVSTPAAAVGLEVRLEAEVGLDEETFILPFVVIRFVLVGSVILLDYIRLVVDSLLLPLGLLDMRQHLRGLGRLPHIVERLALAAQAVNNSLCPRPASTGVV